MAWGTEILLQIQSIGTDCLDTIFAAITFMGDEEFYLLMLPAVYWCLNRAVAVRLGYVFLFSTAINIGLKDLFTLARPDPSQVRRVIDASGYGFPSGHAQGTTTVWFYLATEVRKKAFWAIAIAVAILVGFSRLYLGVHYPGDVLGGWFFGLVLVLLYAWLSARYQSKLAKLPLWSKAAIVVLVPLGLLAIHAVPDTVSALSVMLGFGLGSVLEREWVRFRVDGPWWMRIVRFLLGAVGLLGIYFGLKMVFPEGSLFRGLRYMLVGTWVTLLGPCLFVVTRLAEKEQG